MLKGAVFNLVVLEVLAGVLITMFGLAVDSKDIALYGVAAEIGALCTCAAAAMQKVIIQP